MTTDDVILGSGEYRYREVENWGELPDGWEWGDVSAVGSDRHGNVYAFNRGEHPMIVFDSAGTFIKSWGEGEFWRPHGVHMGPDDSIYLTDDGGHVVRKYTLDGELLLELGTPGQGSGFMSGAPFQRCTHTALSPTGEIYVSDGYGNARIHKYSPDGKLLLSWGECGIQPGQFNIPHNIVTDEDGWVYVADRENHRVQIFDGDGKYETEWAHVHRPGSLFMSPEAGSVCYIGEGSPYLGSNRNFPNLGPRVAIVSREGERVGEISQDPLSGTGPGQFISPHGLTVDPRGDVYVADVANGSWSRVFPDVPPPANLRTLHKFVRLDHED